MSTNNQDVVIPQVQETQVYLNNEDDVVIVQSDFINDDQVVILPRLYVSRVIEKITSLLADSQE